MEKSAKQQIINRINYVSGHLEGVKKMVQDGKYCIDIIHQNRAVISAVKKISDLILENHLNTCVADAIQGKSKKEKEKKIKELVEIFKHSDNGLDI